MVGMAIVEMVLFKHLDFVTCNGRSTSGSFSWSLAAAVKQLLLVSPHVLFISDEAYLILAAYSRGRWPCVVK